MGYTHYWGQKRDFTQDEMLKIGEDVRTIIATASGRAFPGRDSDTPTGSLVIAGGAGERGSLPQIDDKTISFNGLGPDLDHETFMFDAKRSMPYDNAPADRLGWAFCKTARKPYDVVVTAVLTYLAADWGFEVSSDGDVPDWDLGVKLAEEALGREFSNPLIVEQLTD